MNQKTHQQVKSPCWSKGGRAPSHMVDARCEVSIECSDVGLGEVCLAVVMDGVDRICTFYLRLVGCSMYIYTVCDRCTIMLQAPQNTSKL